MNHLLRLSHHASPGDNRSGSVELVAIELVKIELVAIELVAIGMPVDWKILFGECEKLMVIVSRRTKTQELAFMHQPVHAEVQVQWDDSIASIRAKQVPGFVEQFEQA